MKRHAIRVFAILSLNIALGFATIHAQSFEKLEVNIPFNFVAGSKTLPAGVYTIKRVNSHSLLIKSASGRLSTITLTNTVQTKVFSARAVVTFNRYEDQYFLFRVLGAGTDMGQEVPRSSAEARLAKTAPAPQVISVGNDRQ